MSKRGRQYIGLFVAILAYYVIHEGAHFIYALILGTFKKVNIVGLGVQVDIYIENMSDTQLAIFCLLGSVATLVVGYVMILTIDMIGKLSSKVIKACMYYVTMVMLFMDPLYLSLLCDFFGGGDMNGISLICPELVARIIYGAIFLVNLMVYKKVVLPKYKAAFRN